MSSSCFIATLVHGAVDIRSCESATGRGALFVDGTGDFFPDSPRKSDALSATLDICALHAAGEVVELLNEIARNTINALNSSGWILFCFAPIESDAKIRAAGTAG